MRQRPHILSAKAGRGTYNTVIKKKTTGEITSETYSNQSTKIGKFASSDSMLTGTPMDLQILPHGPSSSEKTWIDNL